MNFRDQYNTKSAGVKRLMKEAVELREPTELYAAQPVGDNLFEWHFTVRGPADSDFDGGIYHGRILFPPEYPMKPPNLIILTPNGRFELYKKICLSISGYHPETWLPSWSIRTALLALIGFMPTDAGGAIGSLEYPSSERKKLAKLSLDWKCKECGKCMRDALEPLTEESSTTEKEAKELAKQLQFKDESVLETELAASSNSDGIVFRSRSCDISSSSDKNTGGSGRLVKTSTEASQLVNEGSFSEPVSTRNSLPSTVPSTDTAPTRRTSSSTRQRDSLSLFFVIPSVIVFLSVFFILGARRFMSP